MKRYYLSPPVMLSCLGRTPEENMEKIHSGCQEHFVRNAKGKLVARYQSEGKDLFDALLSDALSALEETADVIRRRFDSSKVAMIIGGCDYHSQEAALQHRLYRENGSFGEYSIDSQNPFRPVDIVKERLGFTGPAFSIAAACASSNIAAIRAIDLLDAGLADAVLVGGVDFASDLIVDGFDALSAVSSSITNPFSRNRSGITLGDGASLYFLTREQVFTDFDVAITGYAETSDGYNMTSPDPEAKEVISCMRRALECAGLTRDDIDYVNLHGTGTEANDSMEAKAVREVFSPSTPVSSTKAMTGHTLGAAGALETAITAYTLMEEAPQIVPPHIFDGEAEVEGIHLASLGERKVIRRAMTSSFAFGGLNSVLILERSKV